MVTYRYPYIAREGWPIIAAALALALIIMLQVGMVVAAPLWLLAFFILFLYRDPLRSIPPSPLAIVAPVDGKIVSIDTAYDPYARREALHFVIKMAPLNVFSVHSPIEGKVMEQWYGMKSDSEVGRALSKNSFAQWVQTDEEDDVIMAVRQHYPLQRSRCYLQSGERVGQGQRCGSIPLGAIVDIFLPISSKVDTKVGLKVKAGTTIISTLIH